MHRKDSRRCSMCRATAVIVKHDKCLNCRVVLQMRRYARKQDYNKFRSRLRQNPDQIKVGDMAVWRGGYVVSSTPGAPELQTNTPYRIVAFADKSVLLAENKRAPGTWGLRVDISKHST